LLLLLLLLMVLLQEVQACSRGRQIGAAAAQ
jgi:hypothetical protein